MAAVRALHRLSMKPGLPRLALPTTVRRHKSFAARAAANDAYGAAVGDDGGNVERPPWLQLALSAASARLAYLPPKELYQTWRNTKDHLPPPRSLSIGASTTSLLPLLFHGVKEAPLTFHSKDTGCDVCMWIGEGHLVIAFRGTTDVKDVIADIDVRQVQMDVAPPGVCIHNGFYLQYVSVLPHLSQAVQEIAASHGIHAITFTGHSLGGALATLASTQIAPIFRKVRVQIREKWENPEVSLATFGAPRVGNAGFAKWQPEAVYDSIRVIHENDIVPKVPMSPRFHHQNGRCLVVDDDARLVQDMDGDYPYCHRLGIVFGGAISRGALEDHNCDQYTHLMLRRAANDPEYP